ncbi:MAG TPA: MlaD family protein [Solirubrobacteraceae bacterium]|jgi:ABC-type transporter Mla subunit MlaD
MRRVIAVAVVLLAAAALAVVSAGAGGDGKPYLVRAIFDNASFVIEGEDVKVAGVKVGIVESLHVTREDKAAIVLRITSPAYKDFRADARCLIRPQSLIGEKFVECTPTQRHAVGAQLPPPLATIRSGAGKGQRLLPVEQTGRSVDLDLINNVMRLPYRQRFSIILNELGGAVAGRSEDLKEVIRRADPALREVDDVLDILGEQNKTLARLAERSDEALAPLARDRKRVTGFIKSSGEVAAATAARRSDLEADIQRLPRFLAELTPTMQRLGELSDQAAPVLADLGARAPQVNRVFSELGPFSRAGTPALQTLGDAAQVGIPALDASRPVVRDLRALARDARPVGDTLSELLRSIQRTGGIPRLMDLLFYTVSSSNGYDEFGHYLRARLLVNNCSNYTATPISGCTAKFIAGASSSAAAAAADVAPAPTATATPEPSATPKATATATPTATPTPDPAAAPAPSPAPSPAGRDAATGALDYLLGGDE